VAQRDYLNGTKLNVSYDANRRITGFEHALSGTAFAGFTYGFDKENNKLFEKRTQDNNNGDAYVYDSIYRLTGVKYGVPNLNPSSSYADYTTYADKEEFTLDGVGNRTQLTTDLLTTDYSVNNLNQYLQVGSTAHSYDSNGNLKDDGTYLYYFDYLNRLIEVKRKSDSVSIVVFTYDALGRRIQKTNNLQLITCNYYYDRGAVIEERDGNDAVTAQYTFGYEILTMEKNSQTYYYHANTQGSIYAVTNSSGNVVEQYKYSVCGETSFFDGSGTPITQSAIGNTRLFAGLERDGEVGDLYKVLGKNFSSKLNRFIQADIPANDNLFNPYTYANNNSVDVMPMSAGMTDGSNPNAPSTAPAPSPGPGPGPGEDGASTPTPPIPPTGTVSGAPVTPEAPVGEQPKDCPIGTPVYRRTPFIYCGMPRTAPSIPASLYSTFSVKIDSDGTVTVDDDSYHTPEEKAEFKKRLEWYEYLRRLEAELRERIKNPDAVIEQIRKAREPWDIATIILGGGPLAVALAPAIVETLGGRAVLNWLRKYATKEIGFNIKNEYHKTGPHKGPHLRITIWLKDAPGIGISIQIFPNGKIAIGRNIRK
jgi:RHS repeat-associated protein